MHESRLTVWQNVTVEMRKASDNSTMKGPYFTMYCGCNERNDLSRCSNFIPSAVRNGDPLLTLVCSRPV